MAKFYALAAAALAVAATPSMAGTIFGSKLTHQPTPTETCNSSKPEKMCSWVLTEAYQNIGKEKAPRNGTIVKVRLRSCNPGSFVLQLARANPSSDQARAVRSRHAINYTGGCNIIQTFAVNMPVSQGEYLSVIATEVGFIYNASGDGSLVFDPMLRDGGAFRTAGSSLGSGILLLQAEYSN